MPFPKKLPAFKLDKKILYTISIQTILPVYIVILKLFFYFYMQDPAMYLKGNII